MSAVQSSKWCSELYILYVGETDAWLNSYCFRRKDSKVVTFWTEKIYGLWGWSHFYKMRKKTPENKEEMSDITFLRPCLHMWTSSCALIVKMSVLLSESVFIYLLVFLFYQLLCLLVLLNFPHSVSVPYVCLPCPVTPVPGFTEASEQELHTSKSAFVHHLHCCPVLRAIPSLGPECDPQNS